MRFRFFALGLALLGGCAGPPGVPSPIDQTPGDAFDSVRLDPADDGRIESLSGAITYLQTPPVSVALDALVSDTELFMFSEKLDHTLTRDLVLDLSEPGDFFPDDTQVEEQTWALLGPGTVAAGTRVDSYYFHYDNATYNDTFSLDTYRTCVGQFRVRSKVVFARPVLGIVMRAGFGRNAHLRQSDRELGLESVTYDDRYLRNFPGVNVADGCRTDRFVLSEDRRTLWMTNTTDIHHDNYRVIVAAS